MVLVLFGTVLGLAVRLSRMLLGHESAHAELAGVLSLGLAQLSIVACLLAVRVVRDSPKAILRVGLFCEGVLGYVLGVGNTVEEVTRHGHVPLLTWTTPLVILFPLVVPTPPRATLWVAVVTSSSSWAGVAVADALGSFHATIGAYVDASAAPIVAIVTAVFGSTVVYGLSRAYAVAARAGSYKLVEKLGAGGMGEVWRAEHQFLARPAAVKLIRADRLCGASEQSFEVRERFRREAGAMALLRSPHTVELYDYGVTADGSLFYVMELLEGMDLESLVQRHGPLPPERVVHILLEAASSLAEAHDHALIHRDVKPANIYLCHYGIDSDFVKVLDFGLVKMQEGAIESIAPLLSRDDTVQGTPAFMSPEQIVKNKPVAPTSDIYSLGCVAYWLLTGRLPFDAESTIELMSQHLTAQPKRPSEVAPWPVPPALERLVYDCLQKSPDARPQSMRILRTRLNGIPLARTWTPTRAREWWALHAPQTLSSDSRPKLSMSGHAIRFAPAS